MTFRKLKYRTSNIYYILIVYIIDIFTFFSVDIIDQGSDMSTSLERSFHFTSNVKGFI